MFTKMKTILLLLLFTTCLTEQIIPDPNYPIMLKFATDSVIGGNQGNVLSLRFQLPIRGQDTSLTTTAGGLGYNQYFGVTFPTGLFSFTSVTAGCALSSATTTWTINFMTPITSNISSTAANSNILYCQLADTINETLPSMTTLTLTITLPTNISTSFVGNIGLFTSTSNQADQYIIDYIPVLGSLAQYGDYYSTVTSSHVSISSPGSRSSTITSTGSSTNILYPFYTISVTVIVEIHENMNYNDYEWVFTYNTLSFGPPTSVSSSNYSMNQSELALMNPITQTITTDGIIISGINEPLYPGRKFELTFGGFTTLSQNIGLQNPMELKVFFKSTYSIISYSKMYMDMINYIQLTASVNESENFTLFDGMAWPHIFTFTSLGADIATGGYVVIRHRNFNVQYISFTFVASSCDFSMMQSLDSGFGKRWNCYPLRNDFNYADPQGLLEGSGIFFRMNSILASNSYSLGVWGFVERCYNSSGTTPFNVDLAFTIRVYGTVSNTVLNEARFTGSQNYLIAQNTLFVHDQTCYPLQTFDPTFTTLTAGATLLPTNLFDYTSTSPIGVEYNNIFAAVTPTTESNLENFGTSLSNQFISHDPTSWQNQAAYIENFFFSTSAANLGGNTLLFFNIIRMNDQQVYNGGGALTDYIINYVPSECTSNASANGFQTILNARIKWYFSRLWFTAGNKATEVSSSGCQVSWIILPDQTDSGVVPANSSLFQYSANSYTSISSQVSSGVTNFMLDITNSEIDTTSGATSTFQIWSTPFTILNGTLPSRLSLLGLPCNSLPIENANNAVSGTDYYAGYLQMGVYTNCVKWVTQPSSVKSLFGYFDVQAHLEDENSNPFRVWRFIKLYPEPGILQPTSSMSPSGTTSDDIPTANQKWIVGHYSLLYYSSPQNGVCLIEIFSELVNDGKLDTNATTLIIWLFATSLLDVDYTVSSSIYPVAPLPSLNAYALNSGQTISIAHRLISNRKAGLYPSSGTNGSFYGGNATFSFSQLERYWLKTTVHYDNITPTVYNTKFPARTMYHFFLGSIIYISSVTATGITGPQTASANSPNIYIPYYCNQAVDSTYKTGVYFTYPVVTVAWAEMSDFQSITKISNFIVPNLYSAGSASQPTITSLGSLDIISSYSDTGLIPYYSNANTSPGSPVLTTAFIVQAPYQNPLFKIGSGGNSYLQENEVYATIVSTTNYNFSRVHLQFDAYSLTTPAADLTTLNLTLDSSAPASLQTSAMAMFLNSSIGALSSSLVGTLPFTAGGSSALQTQTCGSNFYIAGNPFNRIIATSLSAAFYDLTYASSVYTNSFATSSYSISGIPRIPVSNLNSLVDDNSILNSIAVYFNNNIGYATASNILQSELPIVAVNYSYQIITNYVTVSVSSTSVSGFVIDFPSEDTTTAWASIVFSTDISTESYANDKASNILIQGNYPSSVPSGAQLQITLSQVLTQNVSQCGITEDSTGIVTQCTTVSSTEISCNLTANSTNFSICCYNIYNQGSAISLVTAAVYFQSASSLVTPTLQAIYSYGTSASPIKTFTIPNLATITDPSFFAKLVSITYSFSTTISGFGNAVLNVALPRAPARGCTIQIKFNLSPLQIPTMATKVIATFGSNALYGSSPSSGDLWVDSVYSILDSNGITIKLKNMLYKCSQTLSRNLNVFLWPIQTINITNLSGTILVTTIDSQNMASEVSHTVTSTPVLTTTPIDSTIHVDLCTITNIYPLIVDEYAAYTFGCNLATYATTIGDAKANEITVHFPFSFADWYPNVLCYLVNSNSNNTAQNCSFVEKHVLSIRFSTNASITTAFSFQVVGIKNPYIAATNSENFGFSLNTTNFVAMTRQTITRGTTNVTGGISYSSTVVLGNLRVLNELTFHSISASPTQGSSTSTVLSNSNTPIVIVPLNPRDNPQLTRPNYTTLHQFGITIDTEVGMISTDSVFSITNPYLIITFPEEYNLSWFTFTPVANIQSYRTNSINPSIIENFADLTVSSTTVNGNMVIISFTQTTLTINNYFEYYIVQLYNIPPPSESTVNTTSGQETTGTFSFVLTNYSTVTTTLFQPTTIFKSWSNLITFDTVALPNAIDDLLTLNRGFHFDFDQTKWIVDVVDPSSSNIDIITIRPGRYLTYNFKIRTSNVLLEASMAQIQLKNDPNSFVLLQPYYVVSTSANSATAFQIGAACGTNPGLYLSEMTYVDTDGNIYEYFMPIAPTQVNVSISNTGTIQFSQNLIVRIAGSYYLDFTLTEPTFSDIPISFTAASASEIAPVTILASTDFARTVMSMTSISSTDVQTYNLGTPANTCYQFQYQTLTFQVDGYVAIIPNNGVQASMFQFYNSETDSTITDLNSVKFIFSTDYTQIYVHAVLTCISMDFPSDDDIKNGNVIASPTLGYYSEIVNIQSKLNIIFTNLIRGESYTLKVLIESTQGLVSNRTNSEMVISNYTLSNGTVLNLMPTPPISFSCASYHFNTRPGIQVTNPLLWYWQNKFSQSGYANSGCITALDQYGTDIPGLPSIKNQTLCTTTNCNFINYQNYIINQTSLSDSEVYTICMVPYKQCTTDPTDYSDKFNEVMLELNTNTSFTSLLNIVDVPDFALTTVTDKLNPTINTISSTSIEVTSNSIQVPVSSPSPVACTLMPVYGNLVPSLSQFTNCTSSCVSFTSTNVTSTITLTQSNLNGLTGPISLYMYCTNNIPCSTNYIITNVGSATLTSSNSATSVSVNSSVINTSSHFIFFSKIMIIMIFAILLF